MFPLSSSSLQFSHMCERTWPDKRGLFCSGENVDITTLLSEKRLSIFVWVEFFSIYEQCSVIRYLPGFLRK